MKDIVPKRSLIKIWYKIARCRFSKQAANDDERCQSFGLVFSNICTNYSVISMP